MWKYVTRRVKDSVDKTCNILDVKRTWTCTGSNGDKFINCTFGTNDKNNNSGDEKNVVLSKPKYGCLFTQLVGDKSQGAGDRQSSSSYSSSSSSDDDEFKEKIHRKNSCFMKNYSLLGALTWSSAIVCGWYTSQIICLTRRNYDREQTNCRYSRYILNPSRRFHTHIFQHRCLASPPLPPVSPTPISFLDKQPIVNVGQGLTKYDSKTSHNQQFDSQFYEPHKVESDNHPTGRQKEEVNNKKNIDEAVRDLISVLGDIEYEMGVQNIEAGHYKTAVSHLKMATSHNHPGATFNLGLCYEQGLGVQQNLNIAQELYQTASALGHPKAMYNLGVFYAQGLGGLKKSKHAARSCFNAAAHLGQREAQLALGYSLKETKTSLSPEKSKQQKSTLISSAMEFKTIATACT